MTVWALKSKVCSLFVTQRKVALSVSVRDVRKFKETKKNFDRVREDLEIAQVKNAQAPRNKPHEVEEASGTLSITRKCFRHLALDYVLQVRETSICSCVCFLVFL